MKNKLHYFILLFVLAALTGCNEKLSIETEIQGASPAQEGGTESVYQCSSTFGPGPPAKQKHSHSRRKDPLRKRAGDA